LVSALQLTYDEELNIVTQAESGGCYEEFSETLVYPEPTDKTNNHRVGPYPNLFPLCDPMFQTRWGKPAGVNTIAAPCTHDDDPVSRYAWQL